MGSSSLKRVDSVCACVCQTGVCSGYMCVCVWKKERDRKRESPFEADAEISTENSCLFILSYTKLPSHCSPTHTHTHTHAHTHTLWGSSDFCGRLLFSSEIGVQIITDYYTICFHAAQNHWIHQLLLSLYICSVFIVFYLCSITVYWNALPEENE